MPEICDDLRDYGLTDEPGIVVQREDVINRAADVIDKLAAALEPFAVCASRLRPDDIDNDRPALARVADYRRARAALSLVRQEEKG